MSLRLVAYVLLVTSCARGGAEIIVSPGVTEVDTIKLFVGTGGPESTYLVTDQGHVYDEVNAWPRDAYNEVDVREVVDGNDVVFQFIDSPNQQLGVVIAVGFRGGVKVAARSERNVQVPSDKIARYELELRPLDASLDVDIWEAASATCVALVDRGNSPFVDAVLPPEDPDCDGFTDTDCADTYYRGWARPTLDKVSCLIHESSGVSGEFCVLGGPKCIDGQGWGTVCDTGSVYCMPQETCSFCSSFPTESYDCALDYSRVTNVTLPPHFQCPIKHVNGMICQDLVPAFNETFQGLDMRTCDVEEGVQIARVDSPWGTTVTYPNGMTMGVKELDESCKFYFYPSGGRVTAVDSQVGAMIAAKLDNGRGVAIPVVFRFEAALSCGAPSPCTPPILIADTFFTCINDLTVPR